MKRNQVVLAIAALNVAILCVAAITIRAAAQAPELAAPQYTAQRVDWGQPGSGGEVPDWDHGPLSPQKRPPKDGGGGGTTIEEPKPKTDEELRAELEAKIAREIKLLRIVYADGRPEVTFAKVRVTGGEVVLANDSAFYAAMAESRTKGMPAWLKDVRVVDIGCDSVTLDAPSSNPQKRFSIKVTFKQPGTISVGPIREDAPAGKNVPFPPKDLRDTLPDTDKGRAAQKTQSKPQADGWSLGTADLDDKEAIEAAGNALRVLVNEKGEPIGLQIAEDTPEDNLLLKRGGRRGDIIKSVNGKAVKMLADAKRTIREQYDSGVREFEIGFERDGQPQRTTFRVPQK